MSFSFRPDLRESFFGLGGGIFVYRADERGEIIYADEGVFKLFGCSSEQEFVEHVGGTFPGMIYEPDRQIVLDEVDAQQFGSKSQGNDDRLDYVQYRIRRRDGSIIRVEDFGRLVEDPNEGWLYYVLLLDLDDLIFQRLYQEREKHVHVSKEEQWFIEPLLDETLNVMAEYFKKIIRVNLKTGQFTPIRLIRSEWEERPTKSFDFNEWMGWFVRNGNVAREDAAALIKFTNLETMHSRMKHWKRGDVINCRYRRVFNNESYWVDMDLLPSIDYSEEKPEILMLVHDIDEKVRKDEAQKEELEKEGHQDGMTSLKNRRAYERDREDFMQTNDPLCLVYIDINGLKYINDRQGHEAGDYHIMRMAALMMEFFRPEDCYRIGGDEFIVMICGAPEASIRPRVESYRKAVQTDTMPGVAIGYAFSDNAADFDHVYRMAEAEMYNDKQDFYTRFPMVRR